MNIVYVYYLIKHRELEARFAPLIEKLSAPITQALLEAGLKKEDLSDVEVVGGSSRVNIVKRTLGQILELDPAAVNYGLKVTI